MNIFSLWISVNYFTFVNLFICHWVDYVVIMQWYPRQCNKHYNLPKPPKKLGNWFHYYLLITACCVQACRCGSLKQLCEAFSISFSSIASFIRRFSLNFWILWNLLIPKILWYMLFFLLIQSISMGMHCILDHSMVKMTAVGELLVSQSSPKWPIMCRVGRKTLLTHSLLVSRGEQPWIHCSAVSCHVHVSVKCRCQMWIYIDIEHIITELCRSS